MSTHRDPLEQADLYTNWLRRGGALSDNTKRIYESRVRAFIDWMLESGDLYDGALSSEHIRDFAVKEYRRKLLTVDKRKPATVAQAMSAIGAFYVWLELGRPDGVAVEVPQSDRKGLIPEELRRLVLGTMRTKDPIRNHAIASTLFYAGPRVSELVALDTDDVAIHDRKGTLEIRYGKGGQPRPVPLNSKVRPVLSQWMAERSTRRGAEGPALFLSREGGRLSVRQVQGMLSDVGTAVGVKVTPHKLRHTFGRQSADNGVDLESLRQLLGHKHISTTAGYTRPHWEDLEAAVERLDV